MRLWRTDPRSVGASSRGDHLGIGDSVQGHGICSSSHSRIEEGGDGDGCFDCGMRRGWRNTRCRERGRRNTRCREGWHRNRRDRPRRSKRQTRIPPRPPPHPPKRLRPPHQRHEIPPQPHPPPIPLQTLLLLPRPALQKEKSSASHRLDEAPHRIRPLVETRRGEVVLHYRREGFARVARGEVRGASAVRGGDGGGDGGG
mmetsp:Transcript_19792/g.41537  ORF Transcript_19792/g.41537 Transcript_19792/m.41537 type:complete len:200 (+) Transcript_19792:366-965(+)